MGASILYILFRRLGSPFVPEPATAYIASAVLQILGTSAGVQILGPSVDTTIETGSARLVVET